MTINDPATLAEVRAIFFRYEAALMANDLDALDALFWQSPHVIRYGPGQNLRGIEQIQAFRVGRIGGSPPRSLMNTVITTFGDNFATANTEFQREGAARPGRQTQTWVKVDGAWKVTSAHVSFLGEGN